MSKIILFISGICVCYLTYGFIRFYFDIQKGIRIANEAQKFEVIKNTEFQILVVGDSTAFGTGASNPKNSLAGRLAEKYPEATIENKSANGAKLKDIQNQLKNTEGQFDLLFIHGGGNDVIRSTNQQTFEKQLDELLAQASQKSHYVIMTSSGDIGTAPIFPIPLNWIYTARTKKFREIILDTVEKYPAVRYVDFFRPYNEDPFQQNPKEFYAEDGLHPSDKGYEYWFSEIEKVLPTIDEIKEVR